MDIPEDKQVKLVAYKLKGGASAWWEQLHVSRTRKGKAPIHCWLKIKRLLRNRFLSPDYDQVLFQQNLNCRQGNRTVNQYVTKFFRLASRNNLVETESQQVARFINGLRLAIQDRVSVVPLHTISDALRLAIRIENS